MDETHDSPAEFTESRLRNDFRHLYRMTVMQQWVIVSDTQQQQLAGGINSVTGKWRDAPSPWREHWNHLVAAAASWDSDSDRMQRRLDAIAGDYMHTGATELASPIQVRNILLAGELVCSRPTELGVVYDARTTDHIDLTNGYLTSYRTADSGTRWNSLPSWSAARRWLITQAAQTDSQARVDITITGPDPLSGAPARPLMTGIALTARELREHLAHIDTVLGTTLIPIDPNPQPWLDELRYEVLCDAYRDTLREHANPWAVGRRYQHYLHADDLRANIIDFAARSGLAETARRTEDSDEQSDAVHDRLDEIRGSIAEFEKDWTTAPRATTWLDEAVDDAQHRLDALLSEGVRITWIDPTDTGQTIVVGFEDDRWYLQYGRTYTDERTIIYDNAAHTFGSCDELLTEAPPVASATRENPRRVISESIASRLRTFNWDLLALRSDLSIARQLRDAVHSGAPYVIRPQQAGPRTSSGLGPQDAISRDAHRITLTETPDSEQVGPTQPPSKPAPSGRRQPPKSTGRQHRRKL
ncbi:hypothetical protein [Nocardia sp. NPDC020380]|uniref:hypothetical protein n=1 Tax=Nocardia sp. NPDC020380 TaxID=3364309 RepID=UPI0037909947